jgi:hypothetical protein
MRILLANSCRRPVGRSLSKMGPLGRRNPGLSRDPGEFANSIRYGRGRVGRSSDAMPRNQ